MPTTAKVMNLAPSGIPYTEFKTSFDASVNYLVVQAGWNDGATKKKPRVYELLTAYTYLDTTSDIGNRILSTQLYIMDYEEVVHGLLLGASGNIAADSFGKNVYAPFGEPTSGITIYNGLGGGLFPLVGKHYLAGGDYLLVDVSGGFAGDLVTVVIRAKYMNELEGFK